MYLKMSIDRFLFILRIRFVHLQPHVPSKYIASFSFILFAQFIFNFHNNNNTTAKCDKCVGIRASLDMDTLYGFRLSPEICFNR